MAIHIQEVRKNIDEMNARKMYGNWKVFDLDGKLTYQIKYKRGEILDGGKLDTLQLNEFKQFDKARGKIPEPRMNESGRP